MQDALSSNTGVDETAIPQPIQLEKGDVGARLSMKAAVAAE
jgi:hypothetical protein